MSHKRHYERWTNRDLPPPPPGGGHVWFNGNHPHTARNWEDILSILEQTRSSYMSKLRDNPNLDRENDEMFSVRWPSTTEDMSYSAEHLDDFICAVQQQFGLPQLPDDPTPDQLQEALTGLSNVLKPQPYRPSEQQQNQQDQQDQQGDGDGDGDGDEGEGEDGDEGGDAKDGKNKQQQQPKKPQKPQKPKGRPKKEKKKGQQKGWQQGQQQQQQQQQQSGQPGQREETDTSEQRGNWVAAGDPDGRDDDDEDGEEVESRMYSGGGEQTYSTPEDIAFWQCRNAILNMCVAKTPLDRPDLGDEPYNLRRIVKSAYNPAMLSSIRDELGLTVDDVYLLLDTSGSVEEYAPLIASVAAAAAGIVHIYTGTEARPEYKVDRTSPLANAHANFPEWENQTPLRPVNGSYEQFVRDYEAVVHRGLPKNETPVSFEAQMAWFLEKERPPKGSHIIIWTDTEGCWIPNPLALKALLTDYKVVLMMPDERNSYDVGEWYRDNQHGLGVTIPPDADPLTAMVEVGLEESDNRYRYCKEVYKFMAMEIPVIFGVIDGPTFAAALRQL